MRLSDQVESTEKFGAGRDSRIQPNTPARVRVAVCASDPITRVGVTALLRGRSEVQVLTGIQAVEVDVRVAATDRVTPETLAALRDVDAEVESPVVLVTDDFDPAFLLTAVECRVVVVLPRGTITPDRLISGVMDAAAGGGGMAPDLLGELLRQVERLHREVLVPNGLTATGLTDRAADILRLLADGFDTAEIARRISYSEYTVKNDIAAAMAQLNVRNRVQLVASAMRRGVI